MYSDMYISTYVCMKLHHQLCIYVAMYVCVNHVVTKSCTLHLHTYVRIIT